RASAWAERTRRPGSRGCCVPEPIATRRRPRHRLWKSYRPPTASDIRPLRPRRVDSSGHVTGILAAAPMADAGARAVDDLQQLAPVLQIVHEIDVRRVDDQQRAFVVREEELRVGARHLLD